ncbi:hypothetical protein FQR65_LT18491 [Abscondita terminalis]|nr:hypothetical protein FQR65_LT18491 [Abscondita terminalis]
MIRPTAVQIDNSLNHPLICASRDGIVVIIGADNGRAERALSPGAAMADLGALRLVLAPLRTRRSMVHDSFAQAMPEDDPRYAFRPLEPPRAAPDFGGEQPARNRDQPRRPSTAPGARNAREYIQGAARRTQKATNRPVTIISRPQAHHESKRPKTRWSWAVLWRTELLSAGIAGPKICIP